MLECLALVSRGKICLKASYTIRPLHRLCDDWQWFLVEVMKGEFRRAKIHKIVCYGLITLVIGSSGLILLRYIGISKIVLPWQFESNLGTHDLNVISTGMAGSLSSKTLFYAFVWLLPLGLLGIRAIPINWLRATLLTTAGALFVLVNGGGGAGRLLFNVAGTMLLVAAAFYITKILNLERSS